MSGFLSSLRRNESDGQSGIITIISKLTSGKATFIFTTELFLGILGLMMIVHNCLGPQNICHFYELYNLLLLSGKELLCRHLVCWRISVLHAIIVLQT